MINSNLKISDLIYWIKSQAQTRNKSAILIEMDNTIACMVNLFLAKRTGLAVHAIIDESNENLNLFCDLCSSSNISITVLRTDLEEKFSLMYGDYSRITFIHNNFKRLELLNHSKICYTAHASNSIVPSNITRDDYLFFRNYEKLNCWDIMPFVALSTFNVNAMLSELTPVFSKEIKKIIEISPKIDHSIEWLFSVNEKTKIIESEEDPTKNPKWYMYTIDQKNLIAKVHQIEKLTRYKENKNIPFFELEKYEKLY